MFENLLYQNAGEQLSADVRLTRLPHAILLSGPVSSGKLSCALELGRVLSCRAHERGLWQCTCVSCLLHKSLLSPDVILAGPRDCTLENAAAAEAFLRGVRQNRTWVAAARYLFIRSVRKLTARFSPVLLAGDDKVSKIAPLLAGLDELLEEIDPGRPLPPVALLEKNCGEIVTLCKKLESGFMYDTLPVSHIRSVSQWARYTVSDGKKLVILENADRMQESVRNALLKILEEPPENTVFVLTTAHKGAIMPTILSRVRQYSFTERTSVQQREVLSRVFHAQVQDDYITDYLQRFLPISPQDIKQAGAEYIMNLMRGIRLSPEMICKSCMAFEPRVLLSLFCNGMTGMLRDMQVSHDLNIPQHACLSEIAVLIMYQVRYFYSSITTYNQNPVSALELLTGNILSVLKQYKGGLVV